MKRFFNLLFSYLFAAFFLSLTCYCNALPPSPVCAAVQAFSIFAFLVMSGVAVFLTLKDILG